MLNTAVTFFVIALIAIALGFGSVGSVAMQIGVALLVVGVILAIIHFVGRKA